MINHLQLSGDITATKKADDGTKKDQQTLDTHKHNPQFRTCNKYYALKNENPDPEKLSTEIDFRSKLYQYDGDKIYSSEKKRGRE